jgi:hypothetical protein
VAGYSGDDLRSLHMGVYNMYLVPVLIIIFDVVAWVVIPVALLFSLTR